MAEPFRVVAKVEGGEQLLKELQALGGNVRSTARTAVRAGAKVIQKQAEMNAGTLARKPAKHTQIKISQRVSGRIESMIGPSKKKWYFRYFETGVQPHEISGRHGPLVFEGDEGRIVIGSVQHPGMVAKPWLRPAFDARQADAPAAVGEVFRQAIEERKAILAGEGEDQTEE
jgi:HK97 gp10 family phage protein